MHHRTATNSCSFCLLACLVSCFPSLIKSYREARKIMLNIEHRLMCQMAPMYDHLTLIQKVEVFEYALENTTGQDLDKVLWLKSQSAEVWLDRRTNYTQSLAVMSMVGYILGLGDRHTANLMLERQSGKIVHIDFGDCFEVAGETHHTQCASLGSCHLTGVLCGVVPSFLYCAVTLHRLPFTVKSTPRRFLSASHAC